MAQSKARFRKIPEVDFRLSSLGITLISPCLYTPCFISFDIVGKCETCKSDSAEIDFLITIEGITIYCNRLQKPKFVPYDYKYEAFPQCCLFRVKTKGKVFNIQHGKADNESEREILNKTKNYTGGEVVPKKSRKQEAEEQEEEDKNSLEDMPLYF